MTANYQISRFHFRAKCVSFYLLLMVVLFPVSVIGPGSSGAGAWEGIYTTDIIEDFEDAGHFGTISGGRWLLKHNDWVGPAEGGAFGNTLINSADLSNHAGRTNALNINASIGDPYESIILIWYNFDGDLTEIENLSLDIKAFAGSTLRVTLFMAESDGDEWKKDFDGLLGSGNWETVLMPVNNGGFDYVQWEVPLDGDYILDLSDINQLRVIIQANPDSISNTDIYLDNFLALRDNNIPFRPVNVTAASISSDSNALDLTWTDMATNETSYLVYWDLTETLPAIPGAVLGADISNFTITNLYQGTEYHIWVAASNSSGISVLEYTSGSTTGNSNYIALNTVSTNSNIVLISWYDNMISDPGAYLLYWSYESTKPLVPQAILGTNITNYTAGGLYSGTLYHFWIETSNTSPSALLESAGITTLGSPPPAPAAVSGLIITAATAGSVTLAWNDTAGESEYRIFYSVMNSQPSNSVFSLPTDTTSYTLDLLDPGRTYYFWIEAWAGASRSAPASISADVPLSDTETVTDFSGGLKVSPNILSASDTAVITGIPADAEEIRIFTMAGLRVTILSTIKMDEDGSGSGTKMYYWEPGDLSDYQVDSFPAGIYIIRAGNEETMIIYRD